MNVLLTGGMGYIGSHTALSLIENGHDVTILDNLSNSSASVLQKIKSITSVQPNFVECDILETNLLKKINAKI